MTIEPSWNDQVPTKADGAEAPPELGGPFGREEAIVTLVVDRVDPLTAFEEHPAKIGKLRTSNAVTTLVLDLIGYP